MMGKPDTELQIPYIDAYIYCRSRDSQEKYINHIITKTMKKFLLVLAVAISSLSASAESRVDSHGKTVNHVYFVTARWQIGDFDFAKESSWYGLGLSCPSISHWGAFHVGANLNFSINAGLVKNWNCSTDFGPSIRIDIAKNVFFNMPINATMMQHVPERGDTKYYWGINLLPAIHLFASEKFGIFVGPQFLRYPKFNDKFNVGLNCGISYAF